MNHSRHVLLSPFDIREAVRSCPLQRRATQERTHLDNTRRRSMGRQICITTVPCHSYGGASPSGDCCPAVKYLYLHLAYLLIGREGLLRNSDGQLQRHEAGCRRCCPRPPHLRPDLALSLETPRPAARSARPQGTPNVRQVIGCNCGLLIWRRCLSFAHRIVDKFVEEVESDPIHSCNHVRMSMASGWKLDPRLRRGSPRGSPPFPTSGSQYTAICVPGSLASWTTGVLASRVGQQQKAKAIGERHGQAGIACSTPSLLRVPALQVHALDDRRPPLSR